MSYQNFKPAVWSANIQRDLERLHVFVSDCNREFEGEIKNLGDTVKILGVGKPTITTGTGSVSLNDPEDVADTSTTLKITNFATFNYKVDDIDKTQAKEGIMQALQRESSEGVADAHDKLVAELAKDSLAPKYATAVTTITPDNVLSVFDGCLKKLYENDVRVDSEIVADIPVWLYMMLKQAYTALDTDNSKMLENGRVGKYGNCVIKMSNNIYNDGTNDFVQFRTKKAIAFAEQINKVEPYRPEKGFSDAVKGLSLFGAKIVRPKELVVLKCKA